MGVSRNASVSGCEMGPPAEREYAVDPVGVESSRPSAWISVHTVQFEGNADLPLPL